MGCLQLHIDNEPRLRLAYSKKRQKPLKNTLSYYPFGLQHKGYNDVVTSNSNSMAEKFAFGGKEYGQELGLDWYDISARNYDPALGRWMNIDPLAEEFYEWSPYNFNYDNPIRFVDPTGLGPTDIVIGGKNNSSVTIVTDLIDINVDASSFVGDLGGEYTLEGDDILVAALDIVGIVDPTGAADIAAATIEANNGNWGSALLSGLGVIPYIGDLGKLGKIPKHLKTIKNAIEAIDSGKKAKKLIGPIPDTNLKKQALDIKDNLNNGKNSVTIKTQNGQTRYDLDGKAHGGEPTPHSQSYKKNKNPTTGQENMSRTSKKAKPMTQEEIRLVRKTLQKRIGG